PALLDQLSNIGAGCFSTLFQGVLVKRRGDELNVNQLLSDIQRVVMEVRRRYPDTPVILYGESMGALLALRLLREEKPPIDIRGAILAAPVVALAKPPSPTFKKILSWASLYFPSFRISPEWFKKHAARFSHDPAIQRNLETAPYRIEKVTLSFLENMGLLITSGNEAAEQIHSPVLVLGAGEDDYINPAQLRGWFARIGSKDKMLVVFPNSFHRLLFDTDHTAVEATILDWINRRLCRSF
ncbi:MAG: hypothetical protein C5B47_08855, partial [Verrucomicrobia bacterium]